MKIDAINFIRNCYDRKILTRRFYIKLGRQNKEVLEDWACVGYAPKNKYHNNKKHFNKGHHDKKEGGHSDKKENHKK